MKCINCGTELTQNKGKREKQFCNSTCRSNYWQKAKIKIKQLTSKPIKLVGKYIYVDALSNIEIKNATIDKKDITKATIEITITDNSEIEKQIASVKAEIKPSWIDRSKFERYQQKKINELKLQMK